MIEKVGHVKNPLTIIAIFAGLAEVCGTLVLPLLEPEVQKTFVYFLMGFPSLLIISFFTILWFKHDVLYAPSDFRSDESFNIYRRSPGEKLAQEAEDLKRQGASSANTDAGTSVEDSPSSEADESLSPSEPSDQVHQDQSGNSKPNTVPDNASADNNKPADSMSDEDNIPIPAEIEKSKTKRILESSKANKLSHEDTFENVLSSYAAEQMVLDRLSFEMGVTFNRNYSLRKNTRIYDAISAQKDKITMVEAKLVNNKNNLNTQVIEIVNTFIAASNEMPPEWRSKLTGIGVIILNDRKDATLIAKRARSLFESIAGTSIANKMDAKLRVFAFDRENNDLVEISPMSGRFVY